MSTAENTFPMVPRGDAHDLSSAHKSRLGHRAGLRSEPKDLGKPPYPHHRGIHPACAPRVGSHGVECLELRFDRVFKGRSCGKGESRGCHDFPALTLTPSGYTMDNYGLAKYLDTKRF